MRLFAALCPPAAATDHLRAAVTRVRDLHPDQRWTDPAGWHLTLAFLGDVDEDDLPQLRSALAYAATQHRPLSLSLAGSGLYGDRALWAGVRGDKRGLGALAADVRDAVRGCGIPADERPLRAHLTLARARSGGLDEIAPHFADYRGPEWSAGMLHLMQSQLGYGAPKYTDVDTWDL